MARVQLPESRVRARRRKRRALLALWSAVAVFLLVALAAGVTWVPYVRIQKVDISGTQSVSKDAVLKTVQEKIAGGYGFIFARSNIFLYPKHEIENTLLSQYPVFKSVTAHAQNLQTLSVDVTERQPAALWCGNGSTTDCSIMDGGGVVYAPAVTLSGDAFVTYMGSTTGQAQYPRQYLTQHMFEALTAFVNELGKQVQDDNIREVAVDTNGDTRVYFQNDFLLIFSLNDDTAKTLARFSLALTSASFTAHKLSDFEYLDLRFGDKLYYKLKGASN
jgi:cell division septal protein FtsQ